MSGMNLTLTFPFQIYAKREHCELFFFKVRCRKTHTLIQIFKIFFFKLFFLIIKIVKLKYRVFHDDALKNKVITLSHY